MLFGAELRRRRIEAGYSLTDLSRLVHYSRGHISKVETGLKTPSTDLARQCDAALGADGVLAQLGARQRADSSSIRLMAVEHGQSPARELGAHGDRRLRITTRRELLATGVLGGAVGIIGRGATTGNETDRGHEPALPAGEGTVLDTFRLWFQHLRGMGQRMEPTVLMPILVAHTESLSRLVERGRGGDRAQALLLAARYAEYTGWMAQEDGRNADAAWWTDRAVDYATAGGDREMSAYALVRRALMTMYQCDAAATVALARTAQRAHCRPRIRGLAAQREAQGHALAGDGSACLAALDRARELLAADPVVDGDVVIGSSHVEDLGMAATGWSMLDLGRPAQAAQILRDLVNRIPPSAVRARTRYGARLALALASSRQLDEACVRANNVLDSYLLLRSATIRADLRALARVLPRWHSEPAVQQVSVKLTAALQSTGVRAG